MLLWQPLLYLLHFFTTAYVDLMLVLALVGRGPWRETAWIFVDECASKMSCAVPTAMASGASQAMALLVAELLGLAAAIGWLLLCS